MMNQRTYLTVNGCRKFAQSGNLWRVLLTKIWFIPWEYPISTSTDCDCCVKKRRSTNQR
ncbi:hypothetical protein TELCIR_14994 [Teladorsagia circumcincta]|uniref:Uncharacterized protein n=1 Tax=Teladorsagia circumcincta TaxID=45464 RepID=A0A2G9TZR0_TELCI|nr:hypothetical protein TELCIR_14994 [Teladorsagia circumcincta]